MLDQYNGNIFETFEASLLVLSIALVKLCFIIIASGGLESGVDVNLFFKTCLITRNKCDILATYSAKNLKHQTMSQPL